MENASHKWDSEFSTCIICDDTCIIYHRSPMSTESILGSHHVFSVLCFVGLFIYARFPTPLHFLSSFVCAREGPFQFSSCARPSRAESTACIRHEPRYAKNTLSIKKIFFLPTSTSSPLLPHQTRLSFVSGNYPLVCLPIHPDNIPEIPSSRSAKYAC